VSVLSFKDRGRVEEVAQALRSPSPACQFESAVLPELERLLQTPRVAMYQVGYASSGLKVDKVVVRGFSKPVVDTFKALVEKTPAPGRWGHFDALHPQTAQRNRALTNAQVEKMPGSGMSEGMLAWAKLAGVEHSDNLRVLVCDGDRLLAWVGGYRDRPFDKRERHMLQQLVAPLGACLLRQAQVADSALNAALLGPAIEAIGAPAFILTPTGTIRYANQAGHAYLALDERARAALRAAVRANKATGDMTLTRLSEPGVPPYALVILRRPPADPGLRVAAAVPRWGLTQREAVVLDLLARGLSNRSISTELRCAPGTVEVHVSRLLSKAGADSRGALIARFWREG
jgi:DNA-binding CsgD family transcriptional regulator